MFLGISNFAIIRSFELMASCEYCNQEGLLTAEKKPYLESHHIQALGEEGPDRTPNTM